MAVISDTVTVNLADRGIASAGWSSVVNSIKMNTYVVTGAAVDANGLLTVQIDLASRHEDKHESTMQNAREYVVEPAISRLKGTLRVNFDEDSARAYDGASSRSR